MMIRYVKIYQKRKKKIFSFENLFSNKFNLKIFQVQIKLANF